MAGINMVHVPYKGASIALTHILSGEIDVVTVTVPATIPFINSGKLRGLAVLAAARAPTLPGVPTSKEAGYPGLLLDSWYGVMAPAGVRADIVDGSTANSTNHARARHGEQLARVGIASVHQPPADFSRHQDRHRALGQGMKDANIRRVSVSTLIF